MTNQQPIGVFDSGMGGITILKSLVGYMPFENFVYLGDSKNAPYGEKPADEVVSLTEKNIRFLIDEKCKIIVIACNTATGAAIKYLREKYTNIHFVGLEPAIKPACLATQTGNIGVLATEGTFKAQHFITTSEKYTDYVHIHIQPGYGLVNLVEQNMVQSPEAVALLRKYITPLLEKNIDHLVLGCTHFPFYLKIIRQICGEKVIVLDSGDAVARRAKDILMTNSLLNNHNSNVSRTIYSTGNIELLRVIIGNYLGFLEGNYSLVSLCEY